MHPDGVPGVLGEVRTYVTQRDEHDRARRLARPHIRRYLPVVHGGAQPAAASHPLSRCGSAARGATARRVCACASGTSRVVSGVAQRAVPSHLAQRVRQRHTQCGPRQPVQDRSPRPEVAPTARAWTLPQQVPAPNCRNMSRIAAGSSAASSSGRERADRGPGEPAQHHERTRANRTGGLPEHRPGACSPSAGGWRHGRPFDSGAACPPARIAATTLRRRVACSPLSRLTRSFRKARN